MPKEGLKLSADDMFEENMRLVHWVIGRSFPSYCTDDDVIQEGYIGLWKACKSYNSEKGSFSTYAVPCILNSIRMHFRKQSKEEALCKVSIDAEVPGQDGISFADFIEDKRGTPEHSDSKVWQFIAGLQGVEAGVMQQILRGCTQAEAARALGMSQSYFSRIRKALLQKYMEESKL